ncbi:MAG: preprotein translocase subunit SecE [Armatimonadota bacterium]|nr:MAG: preprotein translocase subunit SecE [Armatimonadota bacterium]
MRAGAQERGAGAGRSGRWAALKGFFRDAWLELQKVSWPAQEDVAKMTGLVVAVVVVVGMFVFLWDRILVVITTPLFR